MTSNHYTFGEDDLAARRLALLAASYEAPTRAFLDAWGLAGVDHAIDLGCGPGFTTSLLSSTLRPKRVTGLDASDKLLAHARAGTLDASFVRHDVTQAPFPCLPADLLFCRFLLTHLDDPSAALRAWARTARPGARLLVQETAALESDDPILQRYYQMVGALQSSYGQSLHVGLKLADFLSDTGWALVSNELAVIAQPASVMARLHAMNIRTWSTDGAARARFTADDLATVQDELDRIADGIRQAPPVRNALRQLVAQAR